MIRTDDTAPVGAYSQGASPYGLLDMAGGVWEWTRNRSRGYPYDPGDGREDLGDNLVLRGGRWRHDMKRYVRCAYRTIPDPDYFLSDAGFRVVFPGSPAS